MTKAASNTRNPLAIGALVIGVVALAGTASAQSVEIADFIGTVEVRAGAELAVEGAARGTVEESGNRLRVEGGESLKGVNCRVRDDEVMIGKGWRNKGAKSLEEYPSLRITVPTGTALVVRDSLVFGEVDGVSDVDVELPSCGKLTFGDVPGDFSVTLSGSADVSAGAVGAAALRTSGSGDFAIGDADSLSFSSSGSGDLVAGRVRGPVAVSTSGSGDAVLDAAGDGVVFRSSGSGDLAIGRADGVVEVFTTGSGDVVIREGEVSGLEVRTTGSGDVEIGGVVGDAEVSSTGSGDVVLAEQVGTLRSRSTGSGDVTVNGRRRK